MPAFTLYGFPGSTNTDRVRLTLAEGGFTDFDFVRIDLHKGEQKSKEHLARHPFGKVPAVTFPSGLVLYESRPICKYLARKFSFPLIPPESDLEASAKFDQAQSLETSYFGDPAGKISWETVAKKARGLPADEAVVSEAVKQLEAFFDVAESLLQKSDYMAGNEYTLADLGYVPLINRLFAAGYGDLVTSRKAVSAWWDRVINRPAIQKMMADDKAAAGK